jgi:hypothetical protein
MRYHRIFGILIGILSSYFNSFAQAPILKYYFEKDTIQIGYAETFSNMLHFENEGNRSVTFTRSEVTSGALLTLPDSITVEAGKGRSFPVKYLSSATTVQKAIQEFSATYTVPGFVFKDKAVFQTVISAESRISLVPLEPVSYLNKATNRVSIRVRCANSGYTPVQITLKVSSYPVGLQITMPFNQAITVAAGAQQIVILEGINLNRDKYASDYNITVEAIAPPGNSLATSSIRVVSLRSDKIQNLEQATYTGLQTNTTGLNYTTTNLGYSFYNLQANGNFQSPDSTGISYNANINYYQQAQTLDIYDSWLSYRNKDFAVQVGNVNDNLDFPLYGRGIKASVFLDKTKSVDFFGLQNNYMLLSASRQLPGANIFGGNYNFGNGLNNSSKLTFLYSQDPNTGISTYFTNGTALFRFSENERLELRGGLSSENSEINSNLGYASGVNYYNRGEHWDIGLNNFYSTAYYSGMQRGVLLLDERVSYSLNAKTAIFLRYNHIKNAPGYQQNQVIFNGYGSKTTSYETGINLTYGGVNIGLKPYLLKQDLNSALLFGGAGLNLSSSSYRTELALTFNVAGNQFNLQGDYGLTESNSSAGKKTEQGIKVNANMSNRFYSVSALVQTAPYYLTDQLYVRSSNQKYRLYAFGPGIHTGGFNNRMNLSANYYLSYLIGNDGWNNSVTGNVSYRLKKTWNLTGQISYNSNTYFPGTYNLQSQLGVVKRFSRSTTPGNAKLEVQFFDDDNANGVWDRNEEAAEGIITNLSPEGSAGGSTLATISNKDGRIRYVNLKKEAYSLRLIHEGDRHLSKPVDLLLTRDQRMQVPLVRSGWLRGRVSALKQEYIASKPILEGLRILAKTADNQTFETYTNEAGEFEIPLPLNEYTIIADIDLVKFSPVSTKKLVKILQINNPDIEFKIVDIGRKVIVKEF